MLGFEVSVGPGIAYWTAEPGILTEVERLVEQGDAKLVAFNGGYPAVYEVNMDVLRDWLEDQDTRLQRKRAFRDSYPLTVNYDMMDQIPNGTYVRMSLMDQS